MRYLIGLLALGFSWSAFAGPHLHGVELGPALAVSSGTAGLQIGPGGEARLAVDVAPHLGLAFQIDAAGRASNTTVYRSNSAWIRPAVFVEAQLQRQRIRFLGGLGIVGEWRPSNLASEEHRWMAHAGGLGGGLRLGLEIPLPKSTYLGVASQTNWTSIGPSQQFTITAGWTP